MGFFKEYWAYLKERKKWWIAPIIIMLIILGLIIVFAESSVLGPFIYTLF
ncbi:MAG: DUF5989 family protein [Chloroflexi bacterium]|nr:DUF5989 family protein [Chloroflexota bacterium]